MLFVDDDEGQLVETHCILKQSMSADGDAGGAVGEGGEAIPTLGGRVATG